MTSAVRGPAAISVIVAAVLVVVGVVVWVIAPSTDSSFGWFAYAPLSEDLVFPMGALGLHGQRLVAAGVVVAGLIVAGVALGFRWGRSVGRVETHPGPDPFSHPSAQ